MTIGRTFEPRDPGVAGQTAGALFGVGALVTAVFAFLDPPDGGFALAFVWAVPVLLLLTSLLMLWMRRLRSASLLALAPVVSCVIIAGLDVATERRDLPAEGTLAALNNSFGFGGHNVALAFRSV